MSVTAEHSVQRREWLLLQRLWEYAAGTDFSGEIPDAFRDLVLRNRTLIPFCPLVVSLTGPA